MGGVGSYVPGQKIVPSTVFVTSVHLENELLQLLYEYAVPLLQYRRMIFYMNATEEPETYDCYWTSETFIRFLLSRHPGQKGLVETAGPLLFRMVIYYGSFPFRPKTQVRMSCEVFLRGTQMLSEQGQALLLKRSYKYEYQEELVTRPRLSSDDIRVLFRSMVMSQLKDASEMDTQQRNEDDDRDLLDVMNSIMTRKMSQTQTKWFYRRKELLAVAHTLPSSFSQATEGSLRREELCALLNLLKAIEPTENSAGTNRDPDTVPFWRYICGCVDEDGCVDEEWGSWIVDRGANDASHHSLEDVVNTLQRPEMQPEPISWESFHYLLQGTYLQFMELLCNVVEHTFDQLHSTVSLL